MNDEKNIQKPQMAEHKIGHTTFEEVRQTVDLQTGEVVESCRGISRTQDKEPDFIKIYLNTMMAFQGINGVSVDVLISLCKHIDGYINSETDPLIFKNDSYNKKIMAKELGVGLPMIKKHIKKLVDTGILIKSNMRTIYYVNPWLIARGKWQHIKGLQMHFDIINGSWQVDTTLNPEDAIQEGEDNA